MKINELLEDHNTTNSAYQKGIAAALDFLSLTPQQQVTEHPENPYPAGTDENNAWREGFKHGLISTPLSGGD